MKVRSHLMILLHLDRHFSLMSAKAARLLLELFRMLDFHCKMCLNDVQFCTFMRFASDMNRRKIYQLFDMLDVDRSGEMDFDEFYLMTSILVAAKDDDEKRFIFHHSRTVFDLMDEDGSNCISAEEFGHFSFLFNFELKAVRRIFNEFDVSGDQELDFKEFRMFAMATIDKKLEMDEVERQKRSIKQLQKSQPMIRRLLAFIGSFAASVAAVSPPPTVASAQSSKSQLPSAMNIRAQPSNHQQPSARATGGETSCEPNDSALEPTKLSLQDRVGAMFGCMPNKVEPTSGGGISSGLAIPKSGRDRQIELRVGFAAGETPDTGNSVQDPAGCCSLSTVGN